MEWIKIKYENLPVGEVLLLTTSKVRIIGDWYQGGWRTHRSAWAFEPPDGKGVLKSAFNNDEITHYAVLPEPPIN